MLETKFHFKRADFHLTELITHRGMHITSNAVYSVPMHALTNNDHHMAGTIVKTQVKLLVHKSTNPQASTCLANSTREVKADNRKLETKLSYAGRKIDDKFHIKVQNYYKNKHLLHQLDTHGQNTHLKHIEWYAQP